MTLAICKQPRQEDRVSLLSSVMGGGFVCWPCRGAQCQNSVVDECDLFDPIVLECTYFFGQHMDMIVMITDVCSHQ